MPDKDSPIIRTGLGFVYNPSQTHSSFHPYTDALNNYTPISEYTDEGVYWNQKADVASRMLEKEDPKVREIITKYNTGDILSNGDPEKYRDRMSRWYPEQYEAAQPYIKLIEQQQALENSGKFFRPEAELKANNNRYNYLRYKALGEDFDQQSQEWDHYYQQKKINDEIAAWDNENFSKLSPEAQKAVEERSASRLNAYNWAKDKPENITPDDIKRFYTFKENNGFEQASQPKTWWQAFLAPSSGETMTDSNLREKYFRLKDPEYQYLSSKFSNDFGAMEAMRSAKAAQTDLNIGLMTASLATLPLFGWEVGASSLLGRGALGRAIQGGVNTLMSHPHWAVSALGRAANTPLLTALNGSFAYSGAKNLLNKNYGKGATDLALATMGPAVRLAGKWASPFTVSTNGTLKGLGEAFRVLRNKEPLVESLPNGYTTTVGPLGTTIKVPYSNNTGISSILVTQNSPLAQNLAKTIGYGVPLGASAGLTYYGGKNIYDGIKERDFGKTLDGAVSVGFGALGLNGITSALLPKKPLIIDPTYSTPTIGKLIPQTF